MKRGTDAGGTLGGRTRPGRRPGELFVLELPHGALGRGRPAASPVAWLAALDRDPRPTTAETRRLAEHYAGRAVHRAGRWVVLLGDHTMHRAFRRLAEVDLAELACEPSRALLSRGELDALLGAGVPAAELQPLYDPAADCSALGAVRMREALETLAEADLAAVRFTGGDRLVSGVIAIPNPRA